MRTIKKTAVSHQGITTLIIGAIVFGAATTAAMAPSTGLAQANTMFNRLNRLPRDTGPLIIEDVRDGPLAVTANTTDGPPPVTTTVTSPQSIVDRARQLLARSL